MGELSVAKDTVEQVLKDEKTIEEEKIKSLQTIALDNFVTRLVRSYQSQPDSKPFPVLAIIPFQAQEPALLEKKIGFGVAEVITDLLVQKHLKEFQIVERSKLEEMLSEQKLSMSGVISDNSAIKVGQLINADILLLGSVSRIGNNYSINARLVTTETGKILSAESMSPSSKEIEKESRAYIDLPENWGVCYSVRYMGLTPKVWGNFNSGLTSGGKPIMWTNDSDFRSVYFFGFAIRYFPIKDILIEFQLAPNLISPNTHGIVEYVDSSWHNRRGASLFVEFDGAVSWVKKFGKFYTYLGGGALCTYSSIPDVSKQNRCTKESGSIIPLVRGAIEWRFRKRVGINLSVDYFPVTKEFTAATINGETPPMFTIDPLMIAIFTAFYF